MSYTPILVTQDNLTLAIEENIRLIYAELGYKVGETGPISLEANWDLGGSNLKNISNPVHDNEPVNLATLNFYLEL